MSILRHVTDGHGGHYGYSFHCPGCDADHTIPTKPHERGWAFDGNEVAPTFAPSILIYPRKMLGYQGDVVDTPLCHSFVRTGQIQFLGDCTHALAGRTVPLPEIKR